LTTVRFGILGTARINRRIIPAMRAAARCEVGAVASRERARAEACAREWEVPRAVAGYQAILDDPSITAVYIPLPNSHHVEWTLAAVAAGKHVLCEKPMALDPRDVDRVAAAAHRAQVVVEEVLMYRHEPLTARARNLVADGAVGEVRAIHSGFTFSLANAGDVRMNAALGGGALWDLGGYPISYACLLADQEPAVVSGSARWTASDVDEEFTGVLHFPASITTLVYAGFRTPYRTWLEILGTEGTLIVPNPFRPGPLETLTLEMAKQVKQIGVTGSNVIFVRQIEDFVASVLDGAPPVVPLGESRRTAAALCALYAAARSRAPEAS
jgi:predicted dehydrogenase